MSELCPRCKSPWPQGQQVCSACGLDRLAGQTCSSCASRVRRDDDFCWHCGTRLASELHCWHCGAAVWVSSAFCSACGASQPDLATLRRQNAARERARLPFPDRRALEPPQAMPDEPPASGPEPLAEPAPIREPDQLKIVTVLFADVSGFTRMSENLDPEEVKDIMNECFAGLTEEITSRGGTIDKYIGDCVMALFGAPVAREDDPERALDAALAMQSFLRAFSERLHERTGLRLAMRIGINTGKVLAGLVGHGDSQEFTVMGDAVNLASRLEHACPVGSILAAHETYRMVRGMFRGKQLDPITVKGKSEPVRVVEVLGRERTGVDLSGSTFRGVPTRMIGREREMNELRSALERARDQAQPVAVTVRAPIGMGKSRLIKEFAAWVQEENGCELDFMRCRDYRTESTYAPLLERLDVLLDTAGHEPHAVLAEKVRGLLDGIQPGADDRRRIEAALFHLLGLPATEVDALQAFAGDPEQLEGVVREGLLGFYRARAARRPLVLAVEDLHAASIPFLDLLATLVSLEDLPLLVVMTYRPEADVPVEQRFEYHERRAHISLEPLCDLDAEGMVLDMLQRVEAVPPELVKRVVRVTQGRPLFVEEILADLVEKGVVRAGGERWEIDPAEARDIRLPQSVEAAILSRVDALPAASVEALQAAAVVGDVCWDGLVLAMGIVQAEVVLDDLVQRQFIKHRLKSQIPGEREFFFLLPAVREAVEHHVLRKVKMRLHARIAAWIDKRVAGEHEYFDRLLGHHYFEAGEPEKAFPHRMRAGKKAEERGDTRRALDDLEWVWDQARGLGSRLPVTPEELAETRISMARLLRKTGQPDQAAAVFDQARELFGAMLDDHPALDPTLRRIALETAHALVQAGDHDQALEKVSYVLDDLALDSGENRTIAAAAHRRKAWIHHLRGEYERALELYRQGIDLIEQIGPTSELASLLDGLGLCLSRMKRFEESEEALNRSIETFRLVEHKEGQAGLLVNLGVLQYRQHKLDDALSSFRKALKLNEDIGQIVVAAICRSNIGEVLLELNELEEAKSELSQAAAVFKRTRSPEHRADTLTALTRCLHEMHDTRGAQDNIRELQALVLEIDRPDIAKQAEALAAKISS